MIKAYRLLIGEAETFTFEQRMLNVVLILAALMTLFGAVIDLSSSFLWFVFTAIWMALFGLSRFMIRFKGVALLSCCVLVYLFFPYSWVYSNGHHGVFPYYAALSMAVMSILLTGRTRIFMNTSLLGVLLILMGVDSYWPRLMVDYDVRVTTWDIGIHLIVSTMVMGVLIVAYSNTYMDEKRRGEEYARTIEENYRQQLYYMENLEQLIYKLKSERHDFNNHLGVVYSLLEGNDEASARAYAKNLVVAAEEYQTIVNITYPMTRAMLNYKLSSAKEARIDLRLDINLPEKLRLNEYDLTIILGNLLDNAMEACDSLDEGLRFIRLNLHYKPNYLIIHMENPMVAGKPQPEGAACTTKADAENHGFGLKNIEYLVNKHNGLMKIEPENGIFKVDIALLMAD